MSRREFVFQVTVQDNAEWNEAVKFNGLVVADVHTTWCGPCKIVVQLFKKAYMDYSAANRPIKFLIADAEKIDALKEYAGNSMPVFLFYKAGKLLEVQKGIDPPKLVELMEQLTPAAAT